MVVHIDGGSPHNVPGATLGDTNASHPPESLPTVALSWQRCAGLGLSRVLIGPRFRRAPTDGVDETAAARLRQLARPALEDLYQFVEGTDCVVAFTDAQGYIVDLVGDASLLDEAAAIGWVRGACWSEESVGTNGVALALSESFPFQVSDAAHYWDALNTFCTTAAPVHESLGGQVGALALLTPASKTSPHALGMVSSAARALSGELRMNLWLGSANELLTELNAILQTLTEGILLLQPDGTVRQMNQRAGNLLGLSPAWATGRRLADLLETPQVLETALRTGRELQDEEVIFRFDGRVIACLCTLRAIAVPASDDGLVSIERGHDPHAVSGGRPIEALRVSPQSHAAGFVLTFRTIERVQRLVHRMSGAQARMRFSDIVGVSPSLQAALRLAHIAAESASTVLLHGETGTGKEVFAQSIHSGSARATGPFVAVNCAAIPRELISSELFGYEGGAFTGADRHGRAGKFELASGGTLFLDEIGDMPRDLQTTLLRAIETGSIVRVGGQHVIPVDVRVIAATHKDLAHEVELGNFRSDLYFRLNVFPIEVPPLRERSGDIPLLLQHQLQRLSTRLGRSLGIDTEGLKALESYAWPGNIREMENVIERVVYISDRSIISLHDLPEPIQAAGREWGERQAAISQYGAIGAAPRFAHGVPRADVQPGASLRHESAHAEALLIERTLRACNGNVSQAAKVLGISRTTLWRKQRRLQV